MAHKGAKAHHHRKAGGSAKKTKEHLYDAEGSPEAKEAMDETPGFKRGGAAKKRKDHDKLKHGGHAEGKEAEMRADRKPRGHKEHHKRAAGGRTPYSSGSKTTIGKGADGHESERPPE